MFHAADHQYMAQALRLAANGLYTASPNPRVGCVIVKDNHIIGAGHHQRTGQAHAEVNALQQAGQYARGATAYVTLEPCNHLGRTPACTEALIAAGITRLVAAMRDPNPKVCGSGLKQLENAGIKTASGLMESQARELNLGFISRMERQRPWLRSKIAASIDGATALNNGISRWISGDEARRDVQHWRARSCAILTGIGTIMADNPQLNVRDLDTGRQPLRIVLDSHLRLDPNARILQGGNVLIICQDDEQPQADVLRAAGAELLALPGNDGRCDLPALLNELALREINELHVEAGATLNGELLQQMLIDEFIFYIAPVLIGASAKGLFDLAPLNSMAERTELNVIALDRIGQDFRFHVRPR